MRALEELSELNRQVYMILHRQEIQKILNEVDVVSLGSSFDWNQKPETWAVRIQQYFYQLIQKYAGANDGLVPILSTRILNEPHVEMKNVTHMGSVTTKSPKELAELISF